VIETDELDLAQEHMAAIDVLRVAKNAFVWLAIAAVLLHLVAFGAVMAAADSEGGQGAFGAWSDRFDQALSIAGFVARASVLVINGIFLISLLVCLSAKMGGAAGLARGCVWALVALALVTPWINAGDSAGFTSALYGTADLYRATGADAALGWMGAVRFGLCPILVIAMLLASQWSYRAAHHRMSLAPPARLPIHEV